MQALFRFERQSRNNGRRHANDFYQPLDTGNGSLPWEDNRARRCRPCNTQGRAFNVVVAAVICINAVFIGIETDTGLLGFEVPRWTGLATDMSMMGVNAAGESATKAEVQEGIDADDRLKAMLQDSLNHTFNKYINLQRSYPARKAGAYTVCEYFFVLFYMLELCLRCCDLGCTSYCRDGWKGLDITVVVSGVLDLGLPLLFGPNPSSVSLWLLSLLRVMRVLRILRLFRVCHELKVLGGAYARAFSAVMWVGVLILVLDYAVAVILTLLVGQQAYRWEEKADEIESWFGSIGRAMQTLFTIMTLSGWDHIAQVLAEVIPGVIVMPSMVLYIMLCCFTMASLVMGVISDSFLGARREDEKRHAQHMEKQRFAFVTPLLKTLSTYDESKSGYLTREKFKMALEVHPALLDQLKALDIGAGIDELLELFDRLSSDSAHEPRVAATEQTGRVAIDSLVEAIPLLAGSAKASGVFDLKHLLRAVRREASERATEARQLGREQREEQASIARKTTEEVAEARWEVVAVKEELATARQELATLQAEIAGLKWQREQERCERCDAFAAVHGKLDVLAKQLAEQATVPAKIDALAAQVSTQSAVNHKVDGLAAQLAAHFAAQFAAQLATVASKPGVHDYPTKHTEPETTPCPGTCQLQGSGSASAEGLLQPGSLQPVVTAQPCAGLEAAGPSGSAGANATVFQAMKLEEPESTLRAEPESTVNAEPESTNRGQQASSSSCEVDGVLFK